MAIKLTAMLGRHMCSYSSIIGTIFVLVVGISVFNRYHADGISLVDYMLHRALPKNIRVRMLNLGITLTE